MKLFKPIAAVCFTLVASASAFSTPSTVDLQGETFTVDTLRHYKCGPGMTRTALEYRSTTGNTRIQAFVIKTMLREAENVKFKVEIGNDSCLNAETVTSMGRRHSVEGERYLTGVNGDFFITGSFGGPYSQYGIVGYPNMSSASRGKLMSPDVIDRVSRENAFIIDKDGYMRIDATDLSYSASIGGVEMPISNANFHRLDGETVVYNSYMGKYTKTAAGGVEVAFTLAPGETWALNKNLKMVVSQAAYDGGNMAIPADGIVISADKAATANIEKLRSLKPGDEITVNYSLSLPSYGNLKPEGVQEIIGGDVKILREGETVMEANRWINPRDAFNPRTLIGYDKERTMLVICAIDGRSTISGGTTYPQGADLMRSYGCYDALDFDGGGSTLMWDAMEGTINRPCVSPERAVGNGIFAVLHAPDDEEVAEIRFADYAVRMPRYGSYRPVFYGYNKYGKLIDMDVDGVTLSCDGALGEIVADGSTLYATGSGSHVLTASLGALKAEVTVTIVVADDVKVAYPEVVLDNHREWKIGLNAVVGGKEMPIEPCALEWTSSDASVVTVVDGVAKGVKNGTATLTGVNGSVTCSVNVTVQCPTAELMPIEGASNPEAWKIESYNVKDDAAITALTGGGLAVDFALSGTRAPNLTLVPVRTMLLYSLPDELRLTMRLVGGVAVKNAVASFTLADGSNVSASLPGFESGDAQDYTVDFAQIADTDNVGIFPIRLNSLRLNLSGGKKDTAYRLEIPTMNMRYRHFNDAGVYDLTVDYADVAPVYYNLQGMRIAKPQPGTVVIVKRGARVTKEIVAE